MPDIILVGEEQRQYAIETINKLDLSTKWVVSVKKYVKKRSLSQNALLHKWFMEIANETGSDAESVKHDLKMMFLDKEERVSIFTGEVTLEPKHTSKLNSPEMSEFMNKILGFASAELGMVLSCPEDMHIRT